MSRGFWRRPPVWVGIGVFVVALAIAGTSEAGPIGSVSAAPGSAGVGAAPAAGAAPSSSSAPPVPAASSAAAPTSAASVPAASETAAQPETGTALALLTTIPVKGRAPKTGYDRTGEFGAAWKDVDRNGCDTRNDILRRDLDSVTIKAGTHGCVVLTGVLRSPYTGQTIDFQRGVTTSAAVQIDHVVALMDAWQSGAQQLSQVRREALANDPLNLLAVDGRSNEQKSAGNAATWLPPAKGYRCAYVARQITVKATYHLWVTPPERDAMVRVLQECPGQRVASAGTIALMPDATATVPTPGKATPSVEGTAPPLRTAPTRTTAPTIVHPGSFCTPEGAHGVTTKGTRMTCTRAPGEDRARWREG